MATISYSQRGAWKELIVALNKKILFVNPGDLQIYKEITIPDDLTKCGLVESHTDEDTSVTTSKNIAPQSPIIQHVQLSQSGLLLAVTCSEQKALLLYECRPEHGKLFSVRSLSRASSAISFAPNDKFVLVTDKTGDCYLYDCEKKQEPGKLLLGHLSVVYDVILSPDQKYVITCDRDAKIRVTNFPNCYDIKGYCFGHKEFVSAIKLLPTDTQVLISISGDETIRLWQYQDGTELCVFNLPAAAIKCAVRKVSETVSHLAVVLYQPNESVFVYEITKTAQSSNKPKFQIKEISRYCFNSTIVTGVCYAGEKLFVAGVKDDRFVIMLVECENSENSESVLSMITDRLQNESVRPDDVSGWFKKNFDNVTEYYERKKRRIEEKSAKNDTTT